MLEKKLCKVGNSRSIIIPTLILKMLDIDNETTLVLSIKNKKIIIEKKEQGSGNVERSSN